MPRPLKNPPNPWISTEVEWEGEPPPAALEVYEQRAKSILSENKSPDLGFRFSLNPYQGCYHGCAYCYARPTHQYWSFGAGTDFERRIVVKVNAAERLREAFNKRSWAREVIAFSGNTDCYQPLEAHYRLTRDCLEICLEHDNPVGIVTKGAVIRRDIPLLGEMAARGLCRVTMSVAFADDETGRKLDPYASPITKRLDTLRRLAEAGVPVSVLVAPVIPGINDSMIPEILERAKEAGAGGAGMVLLRLSPEVEQVFFERLAEVFPDRVGKVRHGLMEMRGGKLRDPRFGARMRGTGPRWSIVESLFRRHAERLGLRYEAEEERVASEPTEAREPKNEGDGGQPGSRAAPRPPRRKRQLTLFD